MMLSCILSDQWTTVAALKFVVIPYMHIRGLSEAIQHVLSDVSVKMLIKPHTTLRQQFVHPKDPSQP
jgi:hypothetical protein